MDLEEICGEAIARLRLTRAQFYDLVPLEYNFALKSLNEKEYDDYKTKYERTRWLICHLWNMQGKELKRSLKPEEIIVFPWEIEKEKVQTVDDMKKVIYNIARAFKNKPKKEKK